MIPAVAGRGHSFAGVATYLVEPSAEMKEPDLEATRVAWSDTVNLLTNDIEKAARVMAWTDLHSDDLKRAAGVSNAGAKPSAGAVYHYCLAWAPGENPDQEHMREQVMETVARLGLDEHEFFMVAHDDKPYDHVHVVVNLTHPETGKRAELGRDYLTLQKWALEYEKEHGLHCDARVKNAEEREAGAYVKDQQKKQDFSIQVTRAFYLSDDGKSFCAALENEGLHLAQSRRGKGYTIVDDKGWIHSLSRNLDIKERYAQKSAAMKAKFEGLDRSSLPDANELSAKIKAEIKKAREEKFQEDRRDFITAKKTEAEKTRFAAKELKIDTGHALEATEHEEELGRIYTPKIEANQKAADDLKAKIEGSGFRLAFRRVWRGRKDREELGQLRHEIEKYKKEMEQERRDLAARHAREKSDHAVRHRLRLAEIQQNRDNIPDMPKDARKKSRPIKTPEALKSQRAKEIQAHLDAQKGSFGKTQKPKKDRAAQYRAVKAQEAEEAKRRETAKEREGQRQKTIFEQRQAELSGGNDHLKSWYEKRKERLMEKRETPAEKIRDRGRDYDMD